jgi:hypothetical protein
VSVTMVATWPSRATQRVRRERIRAERERKALAAFWRSLR